MIPLVIAAEDTHLAHPDNLATIPDAYDVRVLSNCRRLPEEDLLAALRSAEVVITGRKSPRMPDALIRDRGKLKWLCHLHGTIRHLVSKECLAAGLMVTNWGTSQRPVVEGALAMLLAQLKQLPAMDRFYKTGEDERVPQGYLPQVRGLDVGLYGFGPLGRQMEWLLRPLGAKVAIYDPYATDIPDGVRICSTLRELFETCAVISIHCGLNDQTRDSVTRELLELLPQGGLVVNTARGKIVDEEALAELVGKKRLLAACDVIRDEGNWPGSPLAKHPAAMLTGHRVSLGKAVPAGTRPLKPIPQFALDNLKRYAAGEDLQDVIPPEIYDLKT
ncbi:MAG: NAD(P)-dependent oxidoreductase [Phycisphaerae bacterium]